MQVLRFSSKRSVTQVILDPPKIMSIIMPPPALSKISKHWPSGFVGTHPSIIPFFGNVQYDFKYYQISISCFLLDIDFIYKLSRIY